MFKYDCPHCDKELVGGYGENVYCDVCNKTYETEYEINILEDGDESHFAWLTNVEHDGKFNIERT